MAYFILHYLILTSVMCSIASINALGLRSSDRRQTAFNHFKRNKYDIIFLQETHWTPDIENIIQHEWQGGIFCSHGSPTARGVAILFNPHLNYTITNNTRDQDGRIIDVTITLDDHPINLVNIYAPSTDTERRFFYSNLEPFLSSTDSNIIGGDFNSISDLKLDKLGGNPEPRQSAVNTLNTVIAPFDLIDIWRDKNPNKRDYTWTGQNTRDNSIIRTRIDKFLTSTSLRPYITSAFITPFAHSDHDLISISLDFDKQPRGPGYWHFNNDLLNDPVFDTEFQEFWTDWIARKANYNNPLIWWEKAKYHIKNLAIKRSALRRKILRNERYQLEKNIEYLRRQAATGNTNDIIQYLANKEKLKDFDRQELDALKIRTKARFTEEGEKSTRYFYSLEKRQQAAQTITTLTKDNLDTITDTRDLLSETRTFYQSLYTAEETDPIAQNILLSTPLPTLSITARESCEGAITERELKKALMSMENNKSPGIDGLTTNFYKHFWHLIGPELTAIHNYSFTHGLLPLSQRRGIISLIFKKGDRTRLSNWRPITLLTTDYKILTKALANRLTQVLPSIINSDQTACIPGRTINDNVSLLRDVINYANETNYPLAFISIDQLKAFDRVQHSFLFNTLTTFGFGPSFTRWIKLLYTSVQSSVKVNGWQTSFITLERGLRQGCALSMPLYVLTAEILAQNIRNNPTIKGVALPDSRGEVKLSQYADDTTFLLRNDTSITNTFNTLSLYERASGAKINLTKCKGLWSGALIHRTDQILNFSWYTDFIPEKILGLYFGNIDCTRLNLEPRIRTITNTIAAWKHRDLSFKGRALVINGLLTSTLWYTVTSLHIPAWAITELETAIYNFFWNYKRPLTTRDLLALPLSQGGFNIHRIQTKLYALRLNTLRRLLDPEPAHWKHFTAHFLRLTNLRLGKLTLALQFQLRDIEPTIPKFHKELLTAWLKHQPLHTRTQLPTTLPSILNEPLFRNGLITQDGHTLHYPHWIKADLTQVKDLCYLAIPGFLPPRAIHELLTSSLPESNHTLQQTTREFQQLVHALPPQWKTLIYAAPTAAASTPQPTFTVNSGPAHAPSTPLEHYRTKHFHRDLVNNSPTHLPAITYWQTTLPLPPTFNTQFWKNLYPPLASNKQGDLNWKIAHRVLPTALSLNRMTVHPTPACHLCNEVETLSHLILHCQHLIPLWDCLQMYTDKITTHTLHLTDTIKLFGYPQNRNDPLDTKRINLLNWTLTIARYSIHKSATEFRLHNIRTPPLVIFKATVKAHLHQQFKLYKLKLQQYYFPFDWCIGEALARVTGDTLIFTL